MWDVGCGGGTFEIVRHQHISFHWMLSRFHISIFLVSCSYQRYIYQTSKNIHHHNMETLVIHIYKNIFHSPQSWMYCSYWSGMLLNFAENSRCILCQLTMQFLKYFWSNNYGWNFSPGYSLENQKCFGELFRFKHIIEPTFPNWFTLQI